MNGLVTESEQSPGSEKLRFNQDVGTDFLRGHKQVKPQP